MERDIWRENAENLTPRIQPGRNQSRIVKQDNNADHMSLSSATSFVIPVSPLTNLRNARQGRGVPTSLVKNLAYESLGAS